jgi:hypothetical protein
LDDYGDMVLNGQDYVALQDSSGKVITIADDGKTFGIIDDEGKFVSKNLTDFGKNIEESNQIWIQGNKTTGKFINTIEDAIGFSSEWET